MNMILHGNEIADIRKGDTIASPQFTDRDQLETFDFAGRQSAVFGQIWSNGLENDTAASSMAVRPRRTATSPSCFIC